jgi:hypothetical protein
VIDDNYAEGTGEFEGSTVVSVSLTISSDTQEEELSYRELALETIKTETIAQPDISAENLVIAVAAALDALTAMPAPRDEILAMLVGTVENGLSLDDQANTTVTALQFLFTETGEADMFNMTGSDYAQVVLKGSRRLERAGQSMVALARALDTSDLALSFWSTLGAAVDAASAAEKRTLLAVGGRPISKEEQAES